MASSTRAAGPALCFEVACVWVHYWQRHLSSGSERTGSSHLRNITSIRVYIHKARRHESLWLWIFSLERRCIKQDALTTALAIHTGALLSNIVSLFLSLKEMCSIAEGFAFFSPLHVDVVQLRQTSLSCLIHPTPPTPSCHSLCKFFTLRATLSHAYTFSSSRKGLVVNTCLSLMPEYPL